MRIKCEACDGTGIVPHTISAHQSEGEIVDERIEERTCLACDGEGFFPVCPNHENGHEFVKCDEWSKTCACGAVEGE